MSGFFSHRKKSQGSENMWIMMSAVLIIVAILVIGTMMGNLLAGVVNYTNVFCEKNPDICKTANISYTEQDVTSMDSSTYLACVIESISTGELVDGCKKRTFNYKEDSWIPSSGKIAGMFFAGSGVTSGPPISLVGMITAGSSDLMSITGMADAQRPVLFAEEQEMNCDRISGYPIFEYEEDCKFYTPNCKRQNIWYTFDAVSETWEWWTDNGKMVKEIIVKGENVKEKVYASIETLDSKSVNADAVNDIIKDKLIAANALHAGDRYKEGLNVLQNALNGVYYEEEYLASINSILSGTGISIEIEPDLRQLEEQNDIEKTLPYTQFSGDKTPIAAKSKDIKDKISKLNKKLNGMDDDYITVHYLHPTFGADFSIEYRNDDNRDIFMNTGFDSAIYECTLSNFFLPQDVGDAKAWIKGLGDPLYLVYWQQFPKEAADSWSGGVTWVSNVIDIGFAWIGVGGGGGLKELKNLGKSGISWLSKKVLSKPLKSLESKLFVKAMAKELAADAMDKAVRKAFIKTETKEIGEALLQRGYEKVVKEATESVTKEMADAELKNLGRKFARANNIWSASIPFINPKKQLQLGEMAVKEMTSGSVLSVIEKQGLGTVVDVTFMPLFGKNGMTTRQIYKVVTKPKGQANFVTKQIVNNFDESGKLIGTQTIGGEVAEEAAKLSGSVLNKALDGFVEGHKYALQVWEDRLKKYGKYALAAYAVGILDARTQRNIPESNKLVVSIPVVGTLQENSVITKAPTQIFVKTKDFFGSSLKPFYLASPCYANLDVKLAPVKCGSFGTTFGGLKELSSGVDNCEKPDEEDTISYNEDCYNARISGDIFPLDIISKRVVELTGVENGAKRIDVQFDGAAVPVSLDVVEKNKYNDVYSDYVEKRVEALRIVDFGISNWDKVDENTNLKFYNADILYIRDPISGMRFAFDFSDLRGIANCGSSLKFLKMNKELTTICNIHDMTGLIIPPEITGKDPEADDAYNKLIFSGGEGIVDLSAKSGAKGDYEIKIKGEGKCAAYNPQASEFKDLSCSPIAYKDKVPVDIPVDENSLYNFMQSGDKKSTCCGGVDGEDWLKMAEDEKRTAVSETVSNRRVCDDMEAAYKKMNKNFNNDFYHIRHKNLNCRVQMDKIKPQGNILKDTECSEDGKMLWFKFEGITYIWDPKKEDRKERLSQMTDDQKDDFYGDILGDSKTAIIPLGIFDTDAMDRYCYLKGYYDTNEDIFLSRNVGLVPYDGAGSENDEDTKFVETESSELKLWTKEDTRYDISFIDSSNDGIVDTITIANYEGTWDSIKWFVGAKKDPKVILMDTDTDNDGMMNLLKIRDCKIRGQIVYVDRIPTEGQYNFCVDEEDRISTTMRWAPEIAGATGAVVAGIFSYGGGAVGGYKIGEFVGAAALTGYIVFYESRHGRSDYWPGKQ